ncbi:unnamed protein product [Clonostachys solani]|uniref:TauD/TfdA-like domain-containing protein n=1 Tax=Clonostachys solani TaxID=160281 RepID=A0A9P0ELK5_9HYPO|nr:unnamed protein product [Clonostachys solani]
MSAAAVVTNLPPPGQPDIQYAPNFQKWQARASSRVKNENLKKTLPDGFPTQLKGNLVWDGDSVAKSYDWVYQLSTDELKEIDTAVAHFKTLGKPLAEISAETFPLPNLHAKLRGLSDELHSGHGFFVIRGVEVDKHTREENVMIYTGLSAHIAAQRGRQDQWFDGKPADVVLTHVKDFSRSNISKSIGSPAYTTDKQVFHTDSGAIVALFALESAVEGGASKLASTWRVYNEIARTRPDLIHTLSQDWDVEVFDNPNKKYTTRPLLYYQKPTGSTPERVILQYARRYFVGYGALQRSSDIPPITEAQAEALDTLHFLGDKFSISTDFQKGDIQYINNTAIFHARDAFVDSSDKQQSDIGIVANVGPRLIRRHLVRFWLRDPENAWETPAQLQARWAELYDGVTSEKQVFPLEPYIRTAGHQRK